MPITASRKFKLILGASIALNILLIAYVAFGFIIASQISDKVIYESIKNKLCKQDYEKILNDYNKLYPNNPKMAHDMKNNFAINVCHRNYKTGQQLDLQPLVDQVK